MSHNDFCRVGGQAFVGKLIFGMFVASAEFERERFTERARPALHPLARAGALGSPVHSSLTASFFDLRYNFVDLN